MQGRMTHCCIWMPRSYITAAWTRRRNVRKETGMPASRASHTQEIETEGHAPLCSPHTLRAQAIVFKRQAVRKRHGAVVPVSQRHSGAAVSAGAALWWIGAEC
jgi:hypothetical protein